MLIRYLRSSIYLILFHYYSTFLHLLVIQLVFFSLKLINSVQLYSGINSLQRTENIIKEAFGKHGQLNFFDIRVFNPLAKRYANQRLKKCFEINEKEKKKSYGERILLIEPDSCIQAYSISLPSGIELKWKTLH